MKKTKKIKKTMLVTSLVVTLLLMGIFSAISVTAFDENNSQPVPDGNGLFQRIRNRFCDMIGICQGGCNLTEITGLFEYDGTNFFINDTELHFGPNWFITSAISAEDYDGDGEFEIIIDELLGLVGTEVTVEGHLQSDGWMSVFTINGLLYREPGQPIWASKHQWQWRHRNGPN